MNFFSAVARKINKLINGDESHIKIRTSTAKKGLLFAAMFGVVGAVVFGVTRAASVTHLIFDGVDDYVNVGNLDVSGTAITLEAKFSSADLATCGKFRDCRLVSKATGTAANDHYWMLSTFKSGSNTVLRFRLKIDGKTQTLVANAGAIKQDVWYHAAATFDGSDMKLYLDGELVGSSRQPGKITANNSVPTWIGGNPGSATQRPWKGAIDEVSIWNTARSQDDIKKSVTEGLTAAQAGLLRHFNFEDGKGQVADDLSTNNVNAVLGNSTSSDASDPVWKSIVVPDTEAPKVAITAPKDGDTISGKVTVNVTLSDNKEVTKTELIINSTIEDTKVAPSSFEWDSTTAPDGLYVVAVRATDAAGNTATSTAVKLNVVNSIPSYVQFDGVNDYINLTHTDPFDLSGSAMTLSARVNSSNLANCVSGDCRIVSKATSINEADHYWMLSTIKQGDVTRLRFRLKTAGVTKTLVATSGDLQNNTWYNVAATYNGSTMKLYLDGVEVGSVSKTGTITANPAVNAWIGSNPDLASSRPWKGSIDNVGIWSKALTPAEIQSISTSIPSIDANGVPSASTDGLVSFYSFNEGKGQIANDFNGLAAVFGSTTEVDDSDPIHVLDNGTPPPPPDPDPDPTDTISPTAPSNLNAVATAYNRVDVSWSSSTDNLLVTGYRVQRNGSLLATVNAPSTTYTDNGASGNTSYTYTVQAFDAAGNLSVASSKSVTTPAAPTTGGGGTGSSVCSYDGNPNNPHDDPNPIQSAKGQDGRIIVTSVNPGSFKKKDGVTPFPTPATTGICGVGLTPDDLTPYTGPNPITVDGTVVDRKEITGELRINANNVTIRNSRITSGGNYALHYDADRAGYSGLLVENTRIRSTGFGPSSAVLLGFNGSSATLRRVHITGASDGLKSFGNFALEDSLITGQVRTLGSHNDSIQIRNGANYLFKGNTILGPYQMSTSAILIQAGEGNINGITVEDNFLSGGGYTTYTTQTSPYTLTNGLVKDNRYDANSWQFGPKRNNAGATYTGNIDTNGNPI